MGNVANPFSVGDLSSISFTLGDSTRPSTNVPLKKSAGFPIDIPKTEVLQPPHVLSPKLGPPQRLEAPAIPSSAGIEPSAPPTSNLDVEDHSVDSLSPAILQLVPIAQRLARARLYHIAHNILRAWKSYAHVSQSEQRAKMEAEKRDLEWRNSLSRRLPTAAAHPRYKAAAFVAGPDLQKANESARLVAKAWRPVDYTDIVLPAVAAANPSFNNLFWKLSIFVDVPSGDLSAESWVLSKLSRPSFVAPRSKLSGELLALYKSSTSLNDDAEEISLHVCARRFDSQTVDFASNLPASLHGSSGILFFFPSPQNVADSMQAYIKNTKKSLKRIFTSLPAKSNVPFCGLFTSDGWGNLSNDNLITETLETVILEASSEASYALTRVVVAPVFSDGTTRARKILSQGQSAMEASERLQNAIAWIASHAPQIPSVRTESIPSLLESLSATIIHHAQTTFESTSLTAPVADLVRRFNSGVDLLHNHLLETIDHASPSASNWPIPDFWDVDESLQASLPPVMWTSKQKQQQLKDLFSRIKLPTITVEPPAQVSHLEDALAWLASQLPPAEQDEALGKRTLAALESRMQPWFPSSRQRLPWHLAFGEVFAVRVSVICKSPSRAALSVGVLEADIPRLRAITETLPPIGRSPPRRRSSAGQSVLHSPGRMSLMSRDGVRDQNAMEVDEETSPSGEQKSNNLDSRAAVESLLLEIEREKRKAVETERQLESIGDASRTTHSRINKLDRSLPNVIVAAESDPLTAPAHILPDLGDAILESVTKRLAQKRKLMNELREGLEQEKRKARKLDSISGDNSKVFDEFKH
jgi:hypothetical protein